MSYAEQDAESQAIISSLRIKVEELEKEKGVCVKLQVQSDKASAHLQRRLTELEELVEDREQRLHDQNEALSQQQMETNATERNLQVPYIYVHCQLEHIFMPITSNA